MLNISIVLYHPDSEQLQALLDELQQVQCLNRIHLIDNSIPPNLGYGRAHNLALRESIEDGIDYHLVINADIGVKHEDIDYLHAYMERHPRVGQVMPKVVYPNGETQYLAKLLPTPLDVFGRRFLPEAWMRRRNERYELRHTGYNRPMNVPYLSGCFMFLRTKAAEQAGLFDERYFMYPEDIDLTRTIHRHWRTMFLPDVTVVHHHAKGSYHSLRLLWIHMVNMCRYFNKWGWFVDSERKKMNNMKKKIAIVAGGDSSEHDVSLRSAAGILSFLDKERYDAEIVELRGSDIQTLSRLVDYDYAYITIHGTPGENGLLQGYLEMMHIPYSCCGVLAAALTFNKYACNHYLQGFGVKIGRSILLRKGDSLDGIEARVEKELGFPCFIKSNVGGSSFGCTKVKSIESVLPAIERAFEEGDEVICEEYLKGTEVTSGVYKTATKAVAFPITEVVTKREFFDYEAKYNGQVDEITPARVPDAMRDRVQAQTLKIYDILGCHGIIRADYVLIGDDIYLLEVNTTPGMTATSFIPQQVRAAGLTMSNVLSDIIENV